MKIIVTDLDGTLLDKDTYSLSNASLLLQELRTRRIPVIFCTSKTRAEVEFYREKLGNKHPFIVENGGALYVPSGYFPFPMRPTRFDNGYAIFELGACYRQLVKTLMVSAQQSECLVTGFHSMSAKEISSLCDLPIRLAELAKSREYDEPFLIHDNSKSGALLKRIECLGRHWTRGGRLYHIHGGHNKGMAVKILRHLYRETYSLVTIIALGDSWNDRSLLEVADFPMLVRSGPDSELLAAALNVPLAANPGSSAWNQAIIELLGLSQCETR